MEEGAVLILPEGAQSWDLQNQKMFLDEAIRHGLDWYNCATDSQKAGRIINNDSFYLITGFHKARSWALAAAEKRNSGLQDQDHRSIKFKGEKIPQDGVTARAYFWDRADGFTPRVGPLPNPSLDGMVRNGNPNRLNQTVFIRGFRITVNKILLWKTISVETEQGTFSGFWHNIIDFASGTTRESITTPDTEGAMAMDNLADQDLSVNCRRLHADARMTIDRVPEISQVCLLATVVQGSS